MARAGKSQKSSSKAPPERGRTAAPVAGILLGGAAVICFLSLASYQPHGVSQNLSGPFGHALARGLLETLGLGAYACALLLFFSASALLARWPRLSLARLLAWAVALAGAMALAALLVHARLQGHLAGGLLGAAAAALLLASLSTAGAAVLLFAASCAALVVATDLWAYRAAAAAGRLSLQGGALAFKGAAAAVRTARERVLGLNDDSFGDEGLGDEPGDESGDEPGDEPDPEGGATAPARGETPKPGGQKEEAPRLAGEPEIVEAPKGRAKRASASESASASVSASVSASESGSASVSESGPASSSMSPSAKSQAAAGETALSRPGGATRAEPATAQPAPLAAPAPLIVETFPAAAKAQPEPARKPGGFLFHGGLTAFSLPPIDLLTGEATAADPIDREGLTATAETLRQKLLSFGIQGQVTQIRPGPVVTMFEFLPAAGIKVSRIASLSDDLAMAMKALRVRIIAPIPGKGVVGIEIPNPKRQTVVLKELVEQEAFQKSPSKLAMCLGKDVEGMPYITDLARMPHLLIAGTTGSGKSVAVNSMIVSMLLRATPMEVRFLMVDPKMLELSVYEGIPHLLLPVVTDAKKAALALRWAVEEMERRYQLLAECGVRNIVSYNKRVEKEGDGARRPHRPPKEKRVVDLGDPKLDTHELAAAAARGEVAAAQAPQDAGQEPAREPLQKLPYLVIIIDELADLMMVASREVETYIARLAQMARAAGIHLMVATQRTSTDVVTGVIKANFPARISFQVASRHDSATIINSNGAENLLGMGDMLIVPPGTAMLTRVHGPYVDEKEIHAVVEHWKAQGAPVYDPDILRPRAEDGEGVGDAEDDGPDEFYDQALAALSDMRFISISLLQRKLRVGYNRAARMIERMERDGVVGPADGAKPREVLIRPVGEMPGA
jgi:S-DNA-T family DNA segregation ATPase FtsK/SpoIIIE